MSQNANFPKLRPGAPLSHVTGAGYHNAIRDALKWVYKEMNRTGRGFQALNFDSGVVLVENDSGSDAAQYDVLGIASSAPIGPQDNLSEFQLRRLLSGVTPALPDHAGKFVVCLDAIPAGTIGRAVASGIIPCRVKLSASSVVPDYADATAGQPYLSAGSSGARILVSDVAANADSDQCVWAYVRLPEPRTFGLCFGLIAGSSPLHSGDATFTVNNISAADMGQSPTNTTSDTMIISNWAGWAAPAGAKCMFSVSDMTAASGSIGHGNFVQGACGS